MDFFLERERERERESIHTHLFVYMAYLLKGGNWDKAFRVQGDFTLSSSFVRSFCWREYTGGASQTPHFVSFGCLLWAAEYSGNVLGAPPHHHSTDLSEITKGW